MKPYIGEKGVIVRTRRQAREDERAKEESFDRAMATLKKHAHGR